MPSYNKYHYKYWIIDSEKVQVRKTPFLLIFLVLFSACGQRKAKTDFNLRVSSLTTGVPLPGGVTMRAVPLTATGPSATFLTIDMIGPDHIAEVDFGNWDFYFVGYSGPSLWQGTTYCGVVNNVILETPDLSMNVNLNSTNCSVEPYISMINAKIVPNISTWDSAVWDTSVWEP